MKKNSKNDKGFSLIETIIYVVVFSFFVIATISFSSSMTSMRLHSQKVLEVNDQGSKVMKMITQTLRNASSINSPAISNSASSLNLVTYSSPINSTIFYENDGVLYITEGSSSPIALTNNKVIISNLLFSNFSRSSTSDIIKISFTLSGLGDSTSPGGAYSFTFNGSGALRK